MLEKDWGLGFINFAVFKSCGLLRGCLSVICKWGDFNENLVCIGKSNFQRWEVLLIVLIDKTE